MRGAGAAGGRGGAGAGGGRGAGIGSFPSTEDANIEPEDLHGFSVKSGYK